MRLFNLIAVTIIYLSITVLLGSKPVYAQDVHSHEVEFEERLHSYQTTTIPNQIFVSEAYSQDKSYPLILCLYMVLVNEDLENISFSASMGRGSTGIWIQFSTTGSLNNI